MPLGVVDDKSFADELSKLGIAMPEANEQEIVNNDEADESVEDDSQMRASEVVYKELQRGRGERPEVPTSVRAVIAAEAICGTPIKDVAETFGVSPSSVSAYKNGATSTASYNKPDEELKKKNDEVRGTVSSLALANLMSALKNITPEKLANSKLQVISGVAKDMSSIVNNMNPPDENKAAFQQVIVFKPRMRDEDDYEVLDIQKLEQ
jgi:predicted transcriptional regulator